MFSAIRQSIHELKNRTKLVRKRSLHRAGLFFRYLGQKRDKQPVFILATRRSGSNLLLGCLNSMPKVSFLPEILSERMAYGIPAGLSKKAVLRHIRHSIGAARHTLCGAKFLAFQMQARRLSAEDLKQLYPSARFIIIYRRSILDQFVSLKIAQTTDAWQWHDQFRLPASLAVDMGELREFAVKTKLYYQNLLSKDWVRKRSALVCYENLAEDTQKVFDRQLFSFLNAPVSRIVASTKKQNTRPPEDFISNYAEIKPFLNDPLLWQSYAFEEAGPMKRLAKRATA